MLPPESSREDNVYMAKLAEQAERYEEMVEFMEKIAKYIPKAAVAAGLTVAEVTGSNVVSVAEDELMRILILVRNLLPGYHQVINGEWNVAGIAHRAYDLEGKTLAYLVAG